MPLPPRIGGPQLNPEIERLVYQNKVIRQEAEGLLYGLTDGQLNWAPSPGQWSMGQCVDHLNTTNRIFTEAMEAVIKDSRQKGVLGDGPYSYGFLSRWFLQTLQPPVKRRFKAPARFQPVPRKTMAELQAEWDRTHDKFNQLLHDASGLDIGRIRITSPAASWIRYPLGIGFWIMTAHDRRHLWQARQVRNDSRFPAASST
jgi:hypothetical protein